ncbi:hypothetical protein L226DRAFT_217894 [Lentinus tigrinus ALCF2SS1-7]|uniref:uncharacterized protein n=1 Tax=Lentinus tigrinus ALCF2SS1-7 TaxID=1328758 RepID=UPI001165F7D7|nr:hypothetical protein L226DRAFT_217894 [Lentinus tigrinus ALCF2SS1-7]
MISDTTPDNELDEYTCAGWRRPHLVHSTSARGTVQPAITEEVKQSTRVAVQTPVDRRTIVIATFRDPLHARKWSERWRLPLSPDYCTAAYGSSQ